MLDLYIDTYITNTRLHQGNIGLDNVSFELKKYKECNSLYLETKKVDIFKYTLLTYSSLPFSSTYINYQLDDNLDDRYENVNSFINSIYEVDDLNNYRSSKLDDWLNLIKKYKNDNWVLYSPNNDHPNICKINYDFYDSIKLAEYYRKKNPNTIVMISFSHYQEIIRSIKFGDDLYGAYGGISKIIYEDDNFFVLKSKKFKTDSLSIYHWNDLYQIFKSETNYTKRIVRLEDLNSYLTNNQSIMVVPKIEICRHFDGYNHTKLISKDYITLDDVKPLFVPWIVTNKYDVKSMLTNDINKSMPYSIRNIKLDQHEINLMLEILDCKYRPVSINKVKSAYRYLKDLIL